MSEAGCVQSVSCLLFRGYLLKACKTKHPQSKTRAKTQQPQSRYIAKPTKQPTESPTSHQRHLQNNPHAKQQRTITSNISRITSTTEKGEREQTAADRAQHGAIHQKPEPDVARKLRRSTARNHKGAGESGRGLPVSVSPADKPGGRVRSRAERSTGA